VSKWFGWKRYKVSDEEVAESKQALEAAQLIEKRALSMKKESARLGDALRAIQRENHVGKSLTHVYRKA
jgi:hypothetical protein